MSSELKLVPVEPTEDMYRAALKVTRDDGYGHCHDAVGGAVYRAMLAAAPSATPPASREEAIRIGYREGFKEAMRIASEAIEPHLPGSAKALRRLVDELPLVKGGGDAH